MPGDVTEYRLPSARAVAIVAVLAVIASVIAAVFVPSPDLPALIPVMMLAGWVAWMLFSVPLIRLSPTEVVVRNSLHSVTIPLTAITEVTGGRRLTIRTIDGRTYIPAAAAGPGTSFLGGAMRRTQAYGSSIVPVRNVDDLRLDSELLQTPATTIARMIRKRVDDLDADARRASRGPDGAPQGVAPPVLNMNVIVVTIGVVAASAALILVLL
ncbi:hypothetical protein [uncultured Microbacterium sp.]|uniref:hypothetical protein n=1 Tax=uncultured Microbacterium sp. TaxID=191216 RepID=UPI0035CADA45